MGNRSEIEDGMGFAGLVPTLAERMEERHERRERAELAALRAERDELRAALRAAVKLVETDVICVRPGDRETLIAALRDWNAAITKATEA